MGGEMTQEQAQAALGKAAVLYAFDRGASVKALASVYHMPEAEVEAVIRRAMANLTEHMVVAQDLLKVTPLLISALERVTANFRRAVNGVPVRDMAETLAEVESAEKAARAAIAKATNGAD
jgi:16S rRNA G527 N7-methylase RsmG